MLSRDSLTLVKYLDKDVLPISPKKNKRVMIVHIKGAENPLTALMMGGAQKKKTPAEKLCERLREAGFDAFIYESPIENIKRMTERGERPNLNIYFAGKHSVADFLSDKDLVISLFDVAMGHPVFTFSKGGGEIPWYVFELPVIGISVNLPTMLADMPMLRTYINAYDSEPSTMEKLVDKLMAGPDAFKGKDPIDSFCGLFDAKI